MRIVALFLVTVAAAMIGAAGLPALMAPEGPGTEPRAPWRFIGLPKKRTQFSVVDVDGARALRVEADNSYGNLVHEFNPPLAATPPLAWHWRVETRNDRSDLKKRSGDDTTLKVCAMFDLPLERVPFVERQLLRAARLGSGESLPAASVCYVWDAHLAPGTRLDNAFTRRMRYIVLQGSNAPLQQWIAERRDVASDFRALFGDESPEVPPLSAIAVGADADNTHGASVGLVRGVRWEP